MFMNCLSEGLMMTIDNDNNNEDDDDNTINASEDAQVTAKREQLSEIDLQDHSDENLHRILRSAFGFDSFRQG